MVVNVGEINEHEALECHALGIKSAYDLTHLSHLFSSQHGGSNWKVVSEYHRVNMHPTSIEKISS